MVFPEKSRGGGPSRHTGHGGGSGSPARPQTELAVRFSRRDREAFEEVFRLYREPVYVIGVLELGDPDEAQDLVQETFRRAWISAPTLADPARLRPWLFAIARNLCVDLAKRTARRPTCVEEIPDWRITESSREGPLSSVERLEKCRQVQGLLGSVPDRFREVLALRLLQEQSYQEIAVTMGLPLHGVKNAIARGGRVLYEKIRNHPDLGLDDRAEADER